MVIIILLIIRYNRYPRPLSNHLFSPSPPSRCTQNATSPTSLSRHTITRCPTSAELVMPSAKPLPGSSPTAVLVSCCTLLVMIMLYVCLCVELGEVWVVMRAVRIVCRFGEIQDPPGNGASGDDV